MNTEKLKNQILSEIEDAFKRSFGKKASELKLEFPPNVELGDFAVAFFPEAKILGKNPAEVAKSVAENIEKSEIIESAKADGPYLNIKIKNEILFGTVISQIQKEKEDFGNSKIGKGKKVMVEYLSPNTNKPIHLGHARNGSLGMAMAGILEASGYDVIKGILVNDRGVHICKSMLAWVRFGGGETPESTGIKGDHFVGKWYVRYAQEIEKHPEMKEEAREMLKKWEAEDEEVLRIWQQMNGWAYEGYRETYENFGLEFDEYFYESQTYRLGKDVVEEGLEKKIFHKNKKGGVIFDLDPEKFGLDSDGKKKKMTVLRADGTSLYLTQDLGTAALRAEKFHLDKMIYVVGSEQDFYFKVLFEILSRLGYSWAKGLNHLSYGMVLLPEGKMKSREGNVVDLDNLIDEVETLVRTEIGKKDEKISEEEIDARAKKIAVSAIKFQMLRVKPSQDIKFDPRESIDVNGFTGPYCQYAYARISGILRKAKEQGLVLADEADFSLLGSAEERMLLQKVLDFPEKIEMAAKELSPLRVLNSVYEISKTFNLFYEKNPIISEENRDLSVSRLILVSAAGKVLKKGLGILGMDVLERM